LKVGSVNVTKKNRDGWEEDRQGEGKKEPIAAGMNGFSVT
jgi:hypothetical protein